MVCLDANVVIEIILDRHKAQVCRDYLNSVQEEVAITVLSLDLLLYYSESKKLHLPAVEEFLRLFIWLPMTDGDAEWAFRRFEGKDFEDALQIASAIREGCGTFVTLDKSLAKKYVADIKTKLLSN